MPCRRLVLLIVLLLCAAPAGRARGQSLPAPSTTAPAPIGTTFALRYDRAEIADIVRAVSEKTGTPYSFDERLRGKVTLTSPRPVTSEEAVQLLATALRTLGFALVRTGSGLNEVVPIAESPGRVEVSASTPRAFVDLPVTTLASLRAASAEAIVPVIQPLLGSNAVVQAFAPTNTLILSATEGQIHRALLILRALDRAEERKLLVLRTRFREADDLLPLVQATFPESRRASESLRIVADARSNALLIEGPPELVAEVRDFVRTIDLPVRGEGRVQVVRLYYADAEELAEVLQQAARPVSAPSPAAARPEAGDDVAAAAADVLAGHDFSLAADPGTNSLVIRSDAETFRLLGELIAALDVDVPSVSVKATLLEIEGSDSLDVAIDTVLPFTRPATPSDGKSFVRMLNSGDPSLLGPQPRDGDEAFILRFFKDPVTYTRTATDGSTVTESLPSYAVDVKAQATEGTTQLLSEPHLVARSGEEQELFIGNNIPIPSAAQTAASGEAAASDIDTLSLSQTIERQDVGIQLRIKPNVPEDGPVRLELRLELTALTAPVAGNVTEVGPTLLKQSVESTLYLTDGAGAVVGVRGQPTQEVRRTGTPWLMDVPGLGWFFSGISEEVVRRDLALAVQVKVLRSAADLESESIRRRVALERSLAGLERLPVAAGEAPFAVWVATEQSRDAAEALAVGLDIRARRAQVLAWGEGEPRRFDVYLVGFDRYADAAQASLEVRSLGLEPEVVALPEGAD